MVFYFPWFLLPGEDAVTISHIGSREQTHDRQQNCQCLDLGLSGFQKWEKVKPCSVSITQSAVFWYSSKTKKPKTNKHPKTKKLDEDIREPELSQMEHVKKKSRQQVAELPFASLVILSFMSSEVLCQDIMFLTNLLYEHTSLQVHDPTN